MAAVVVVPAFEAHDRRDDQPNSRRQPSPRHGVFDERRDALGDGNHAKANPDAENIVGTHVNVVPFARFGGGRIEIHDQRHARQEEQQPQHQQVAAATEVLDHDAQQTEQEGQHKEIIVRFVVRNGVREILRNVERQQIARAFFVTLAAHEIPHEIPPVHMADLVFEHKSQVVGHRRFLALGQVLHLAVELRVVGLSAVHPGQQHTGTRLVLVLRLVVDDGVLAVLLAVNGFTAILFNGPRDERRAVQQRTATVLFALQVRHEAQGAVGVVFVDGRVVIGPHQYKQVAGIADQHESKRQQSRVQQSILFDLGVANAVNQRPYEGNDEENGTAPEGQPQQVDEFDFKPTRQTRQAGNDARVDNDENQATRNEGHQTAEEGDFLVFFVIIHQGQTGNRDQIQQVDANGKTDEVGNENQPAILGGRVFDALPLEHCPDDDGRKERRHPVNFCLDRRKPE